jgi:hypothetical protein
MQTQEKLQNDHHQKWSTYLQQFHLNIKYKIGITNHIVDFLILPLVASLTKVLNSCNHESSMWPQLYERDHEFSVTYQMLGANTTIIDLHIQDGFLYHIGHLCIPSRELAKMILEAHYSWVARHFGVEKIVVVLQQHLYWSKP